MKGATRDPPRNGIRRVVSRSDLPILNRIARSSSLLLENRAAWPELLPSITVWEMYDVLPVVRKREATVIASGKSNTMALAWMMTRIGARSRDLGEFGRRASESHIPLISAGRNVLNFCISMDCGIMTSLFS